MAGAACHQPGLTPTWWERDCRWRAWPSQLSDTLSAADPGEPGAGGRGSPATSTSCCPAAWSGDPGHESDGTGTARGARVSGAAAAAACRPRRRVVRTGRLRGGGAVRGPGPGGTPRLHPHRGQRRGGGGDRPAWRPAAGHRAGRRPHRLLDPDTLRERLAASLDALGTGAVDLPERQHTLRATVGGVWTCSRRRSDRCWRSPAVFEDGWAIEAAARVAAWTRAERWSCPRRWSGTA